MLYLVNNCRDFFLSLERSMKKQLGIRFENPLIGVFLGGNGLYSISILAIVLMAVWCFFLGIACADKTPSSGEATLPTEEISAEPEVGTYSFYPEAYQEEKTDTLLDEEANLRLQLHHYTLMDKGSEMVSGEGPSADTVFSRDFAATIKLWHQNQLILDSTFVKEVFEEVIPDEDFLHYAVLMGVNLERWDAENQEVVVGLWISMPESCYTYYFEVFIGLNGQVRYELSDIG